MFTVQCNVPLGVILSSGETLEPSRLLEKALMISGD